MVYLVDPIDPKLGACTAKFVRPLYGIVCAIYYIEI